MSKRCGECKTFLYKKDEKGNVQWWLKGECSKKNKEVYDAALCDSWSKRPVK